MLIINTEVKPSVIHGTGLFTKQRLMKGQIIWVLHKNFDQAFTKQAWEMLPLPARNYLRTYMYWSERLQRYVACLDDSRHMNHSESPNTEAVYFARLDEVPPGMKDSAHLTQEQWDMVDVLEGFVITTKEIAENEELSCNYNLDFPDLGGAGTLDFLKKQ